MNPSTTEPAAAPAGVLRRWLPLIVLAGIMGLVFAMGWHRHLSLKTIGINYDALRTHIADHLVVSLLAYMGLYVVIVALSLPVGLFLTLAGGLLFGWQISAPATVIGATIGATIVFLVVNTS